jgi:hypothetical protein
MNGLFPVLFFFSGQKTVMARAQATKRLSAWVLHHSGLQRAKALFCHIFKVAQVATSTS